MGRPKREMSLEEYNEWIASDNPPDITEVIAEKGYSRVQIVVGKKPQTITVRMAHEDKSS